MFSMKVMLIGLSIDDIQTFGLSREDA